MKVFGNCRTSPLMHINEPIHLREYGLSLDLLRTGIFFQFFFIGGTELFLFNFIIRLPVLEHFIFFVLAQRVQMLRNRVPRLEPQIFLRGWLRNQLVIGHLFPGLLPH